MLPLTACLGAVVAVGDLSALRTYTSAALARIASSLQPAADIGELGPHSVRLIRGIRAVLSERGAAA